MRCDVCDTKIPPGSDTCPNCGYRIRKSHVSSTAVNQTKTSTEYPEPEVFQNRRKRVRRNRTQYRTNQNVSSYIKRILVVIVIAGVIANIVPLIIGVVDHLSFSEEVSTISGESFEEGINDGYDDGTMDYALTYEQDIESFLKDNLQLEEVDVNENYYIYEDEGVQAYTNISGHDDRMNVTVALTFYGQTLERQNITISWNNDGSIQEFPLSLDDNKLNMMNDKFNTQIQDTISKYAPLMETDEDDKTRHVVSDYTDNSSLYLSETVEGDRQECFTYLSIGQDIG